MRRMRRAGITIFPFILIDQRFRTDAVLLNHEKIHIRQQLELLVLPFYFLYLGNYLINLIRYRNHHKAYRNIIFEKEAYRHESNLSYLGKRRLFAFFRLW